MPSRTSVTPERKRLPTRERQRADLFPVFLKLNGRHALVVGGGKIAALRVKQLIKAGAKVTVVSPKTGAEVEALERAGSIELVRRGLERSDVSKRYFIVIGASNDPEAQKTVFEEAERHSIVCNVVDNPEYCSFYTPAVVERGDLKIAISTSGRSPSLAGKLRQYLEEAIPENAADLAETVGLLRSKLRLEIPRDLEAQKKLVGEFVEKVLKK